MIRRFGLSCPKLLYNYFYYELLILIECRFGVTSPKLLLIHLTNGNGLILLQLAVIIFLSVTVKGLEPTKSLFFTFKLKRLIQTTPTN